MKYKCDHCLDEGLIDDGKGRHLVCTSCDADAVHREEWLRQIEESSQEGPVVSFPEIIPGNN